MTLSFSMASLKNYRFVVPGIMAFGGAMKRLEGYLTLEVKQRLRDMQGGKKDVPVGHI